MKKYTEKMVKAYDILINALNRDYNPDERYDLYDAALQAEIAGCGEEFLRVVKNCTFYNGQIMLGGMSGKPIPYIYGNIKSALKYLSVDEDIDVDNCPKFGQVYETRTETKRFCEVYR